jgi:pimeloyl-ACP methyl ester carboxylesterase
MEKTKTYVLVHGAWHGAWCWKHVARSLRSAGHEVYTPTQTGLGERSHLLTEDIQLDTFVKDVVNLLEWEELENVVLVGHSFGGIAVTGAADLVPERIGHLVYLDSLILQHGQSAFSVVPPEVAAARRELAMTSSGGVTIPVPEPQAFGVSDPTDAAWLRAKCTPHPLSTYEDRFELHGPVGNNLPATYIAVRPDYAPLAAVREFARSQKNWAYMEMDAGHDAMITSPEPLSRILLAIQDPALR